MIQTHEPTLATVRAGLSDGPFCPECGQPLNLARSHSEQDLRNAVSWRSIFVIVLGLFLSIVFGLGAWHATQTLQRAAACPPTAGDKSCAALPNDLALAIVSRRVSTADAFAARSAQLELGRDVRFATVGVAGFAVGLGAILLRAKRSRLHRLPLGIDLWIAAEGLLALFYGQIVVISAYHLVHDAWAGVPLSFDGLGAGLARALSSFFSLAGVG